jgi:O-antigen ligase
MIYLTVSLFPKDREELRFSLKWLYIGFAIALLWASFQIVYVIKFDQRYFSWLNELQGMVSTRRLFDKRISGMTYEPSWFAEQLTFLIMPFTFASVLGNYSVFRWRFSKLNFEVLLLAWSFLALIFTYSRTGLANFIILLVVSIVMGFGRLTQKRIAKWSSYLKLILLITLVLVILAGVVFLAAQRNNYFSRLWGYWTDDDSEGTYFYYIAFSQRFTYWETAYRIFVDHSLLGIGLGNYTFYFQEYLPDQQYRNPELIMKLVPEKGRNQVVTVKNFGLRILAETGILGASGFIAFFIALVGCVIYLARRRDSESRFFGEAGLLGLVSFLPVSLSIDSFAIPNTWIVFGFLTASAFVVKNRAERRNHE